MIFTMKFNKYLVPIFLFVISINLSFSQSPQLLRSEGEIPDEFITRSTTKYKEQVLEIGKDIKNRDKKNQKQFLLQSNYAIDDILKSGMVLFNDPASVYVNKVLGNLPIDEELKNRSPRAYILNSSAVNAFATDQGIIFVSLGLLARLENEAQLAFILSHELMHIQHRHSIDKFVTSKAVDKRKSRKGNMDEVAIDRKFFEKAMYSRTLEEEADEDGFELFLKSDYDPNATENVFKMLYYSYLPFDEVIFEKSFFEDQNYILPNHLWLDSVNVISVMTDNEEEVNKSTHPSSFKRMLKLKSKLIDLKEEKGNQKFLLPEEEFFKIQKMARYQIPFLNLYNENFPEAIYTSHLLLKKYPDDAELKKVIGKSLYMTAKYSNEEELDKIIIEIDSNGEANDRNRIEGASHQVYNLLNVMDRKGLTILALRYNWKLYQSLREDAELKALLDDLFMEFASHYDNLEEFSNHPKSKDTVRMTDEVKKEEEIDKNRTINATPYWSYAFVNELDEEAFKKNFDSGLENLKKQKEIDEYYESSKGRKEIKKIQKREKRKGKSLDINRVVVVNPFYLSIDTRRNRGVQFIRSEKKQAQFSKILKKNAKHANLDVTLLDVDNLSKNDVEKFNDIAEVNHYFTQQMNHYDLSLTPGYNQNQINDIAEKYRTPFFLWTGVISLREKNNYASLLYGILIPYILPIILPEALTPNYDMLYYAILFDVRSGRRSIIKMDYFNKKDGKAILNAHVYDVFHQIYKKK